MSNDNPFSWTKNLTKALIKSEEISMKDKDGNYIMHKFYDYTKEKQEDKEIIEEVKEEVKLTKEELREKLKGKINSLNFKRTGNLKIIYDTPN